MSTQTVDERPEKIRRFTSHDTLEMLAGIVLRGMGETPESDSPFARLIGEESEYNPGGQIELDLKQMLDDVNECSLTSAATLQFELWPDEYEWKHHDYLVADANASMLLARIVSALAAAEREDGFLTREAQRLATVAHKRVLSLAAHGRRNGGPDG